MAQHFLLAAGARSLSAAKIVRMPDNGVEDVFLRCTAQVMVFKLVIATSKAWRWLKRENRLPEVVRGVTFCNGVEVTDTPTSACPWPRWRVRKASAGRRSRDQGEEVETWTST